MKYLKSKLVVTYIHLVCYVLSHDNLPLLFSMYLFVEICSISLIKLNSTCLLAHYSAKSIHPENKCMQNSN